MRFLELASLMQTVAEYFARGGAWSPIGKLARIIVEDSYERALVGRPVIGTVRAIDIGHRDATFCRLLVELERALGSASNQWLVLEPDIRSLAAHHLVLQWSSVTLIAASSFCEADELHRVVATGRVRLATPLQFEERPRKRHYYVKRPAMLIQIRTCLAWHTFMHFVPASFTTIVLTTSFVALLSDTGARALRPNQVMLLAAEISALWIGYVTALATLPQRVSFAQSHTGSHVAAGVVATIVLAPMSLLLQGASLALALFVSALAGWISGLLCSLVTRTLESRSLR